MEEIRVVEDVTRRLCSKLSFAGEWRILDIAFYRERNGIRTRAEREPRNEGRFIENEENIENEKKGQKKNVILTRLIIIHVASVQNKVDPSRSDTAGTRFFP